MKQSIIILAIIFVHICVCCSKSSKWWETYLDIPLSSSTPTVTYSDTKLFRQLTEALQPVMKIGNEIRVEQALNVALNKFSSLKRSDPHQVHRAIVFVKQMHVDALEKILYEVSDPLSVHYGQHLTREEITSITNDANAVKRVEHYFQNQGFQIVDRSLGSEFLMVEGKFHLWESVLNTEFFHFQSLSTSSKIIQVHRAKSYSIPLVLTNHIHAIFNIVDFPDPDYVKSALYTPLPNMKFETLIKSGYVTPRMLNSYYDIRNNTGSALTSQGVYETIGQSYSPTDLTFFQDFFHLPKETVAVDINGHNSDSDCIRNPNNCVEANLDIQYLMAIAQHVPTTYYYWSGQDFMLDWITEVSRMISPPEVMSISYGADENQLPASYMDAFNLVAMQLGLQGVTITASSGDDGAISTRARKNPLYCGYAPSFPASSPYVTAVGGTMGPENGAAEVACQGDLHGSITTGGGFSTIASTPRFQTNEIDSYFQTVQTINKSPFVGYARTGRGYPDISLLAHNYVIALNQNLTAVSGTSASSPVFAGMIGLINSARKQAGKSALGWLNPALYTYGPQFVKDIVVGDNHCVAGGIVCCSQGYTATTGWDPVTGLGSVNFTSMNAVLTALGSSSSDGPAVPTLAPVTTPISPSSPAPSVTPTLAPTQSAGWMYLRQYSAEECGGEIISVSGVPTNVCMVEYDNAGVVVSSRKYICGANSVELNFYSDSQCTATAVIQSQEYYFGCAVHVQDSYYSSATSPAYSVDLMCSEGHTTTPPLPSYDGSYVLHSVYDDPTGCTAGLESSVDAFKAHHCFNLIEEQLSYKFNYPNAIVYNGLNCPIHAQTQSEPLPTECLASAGAAGGGNDDGYYYSGDQKERKQVPTVGDIGLVSRALGSGDDYYATYGYGDDYYSDQQNDTATIATTVTKEKTNDLIRRVLHALDGGNDDGDDDGAGGGGVRGNVALFERWSNAVGGNNIAPPSVPVLQPTLQPTTASNERKSNSLSPTMPSTIVSGFQVTYSQILTGISANNFLKCGTKCVSVLTSTIVQLIPSIIESNITFLDAQDTFVPSASSSSFKQQQSAINTVIGCNITYTIASTPSALRFTDVSIAVKELSIWLTNLVSSGPFDLVFHYHALAMEVKELLIVQSPSLQFLKVIIFTESEGTSSTDNSENNSNNNNNADSAPLSSSSNNAMIIALVVVGIVAIGVGIYALSCCNKAVGSNTTSSAATSAYAEVSLESDSMHANAFTITPHDDDEDDEKKNTSNNQIQMMESQHNPVYVHNNNNNNGDEDEEMAIEMTPVKHHHLTVVNANAATELKKNEDVMVSAVVSSEA